MSYLENIPLEILMEIFRCCNTASLARVGSTCKALWRESRSLMYAEVDLCYCDRENVPREHGAGWTSAWGSDRKIPRQLLDRQVAFIRALRCRPSFASYVKRLRWTLLWPDWNIKEARRYEDYKQVWETFSCMTAVQDLDLTSYHNNTKSYVRNSPAQLFPSATNVRLGGPMHRGLAQAVLITPRQIQSLVLFNLQDEGVDLRGHPMVTSQRAIAWDLGPDKAYTRQEGDTRDGVIFWVPSGPMRGLLPSVAASLSSLTKLYIGKPGESHVSSRTLKEAQDEQSYREYAELVQCVCRTLEHFEFEQCGYMEEVTRGCELLGQRWRPMDERFKRILLPSLLAGQWQRLKRMKIVGVGHWEGNPPILNEEDIRQLSSAIGQAVLEIRESGENSFNPFYAYKGHDRWDSP